MFLATRSWACLGPRMVGITSAFTSSSSFARALLSRNALQAPSENEEGESATSAQLLPPWPPPSLALLRSILGELHGRSDAVQSRGYRGLSTSWSWSPVRLLGEFLDRWTRSLGFATRRSWRQRVGGCLIREDTLKDLASLDRRVSRIEQAR